LWNSHILRRKIMSVSYKSRILRLPSPLPRLQTIATGVKGQRVRFHSNVRGIYRYASIATRKGALVIVTLKSFWNFLEPSKRLYKSDISTIVSSYSKYCRFWFFTQIKILYIYINEYVYLY
jgi:hypothetical protein